jgi:hypothetical protein
MIYAAYDQIPEREPDPPSQGDIIDNCPILLWPDDVTDVSESSKALLLRVRVVILTQACDFAQKKVKRVLISVVKSAAYLVETGQLKARYIRESVRTGRVYGKYFLQADDQIGLCESLVDLRDVHTVPLEILRTVSDSENHVCRIMQPYRDHLAQHFSATYGRIGLPEPYESEPEE